MSNSVVHLTQYVKYTLNTVATIFGIVIVIIVNIFLGLVAL